MAVWWSRDDVVWQLQSAWREVSMAGSTSPGMVRACRSRDGRLWHCLLVRSLPCCYFPTNFTEDWQLLGRCAAHWHSYSLSRFGKITAQ